MSSARTSMPLTRLGAASLQKAYGSIGVHPVPNAGGFAIATVPVPK